MKQIIIVLLLIFPILTGHAQQARELNTSALITPFHLQVTDQKTTVILFPSPIQSVDRGSVFILADKVKGAENVLKLKAQNKYMQPSNLSVVTTDGQLFSFTVDYMANPAYQAIDLKRQFAGQQPGVVLSPSTINETYLQQQAIKVFSSKIFMAEEDAHHRMSVTLLGIYSVGDLLYFRFSTTNHSKVDYTCGQTRFYIADRKRSKRTAIQEDDITPVYISPDFTSPLLGKHSRQFVVAFNRFTIADNKRVNFVLTEQNGDRNLHLSLKGDKLLKAVAISQ